MILVVKVALSDLPINSWIPYAVFYSPGVMKWRDLIINLVSKEIKIRYMGATLGFVWSLGNPLVVTLTYYTVFTYILPSSQDRFALHRDRRCPLDASGTNCFAKRGVADQ